MAGILDLAVSEIPGKALGSTLKSFIELKEKLIMKEQLIVFGYVLFGALAVWLLTCYPDVLSVGL